MVREAPNLKSWLLEVADGEPIEAVVLGEMDWGTCRRCGSSGVAGYGQQIRGRVLTWEQAAPMLDYEFDDGYGAPGCNAVYAWTATKVIRVSQYDGSTSLFWIPRHPADCIPTMPGGG